MPSLKEVRTRISSVNSTKQITSAMKMVAASKLRKAQNAILTMRPYASKLRELLQDLSASFDDLDENIYAEKREPEKILIISITSNKGLCGSFNANVIKKTNHLIKKSFKSQYKNGNVFLFCIGKKSWDYFRKARFKNLEYDIDILDNLSFENAVPVAENLMKRFAVKEFDKIEIVYNQFKNVAVQHLVAEQFLPVFSPDHKVENKDEVKPDYIFEPNKVDIVKELIPKTLKIQFYKALLDSYASEQGARMTAMHKATDNAEELLKELRLKYNKARQASITNELLEIIAGAEALNG